MGSLVTYLVYSKCWPDYTTYFRKYLEVFEIVIIYKVSTVYDIYDSVTLAPEIIPNAFIPFFTPRIPTFLRELYLYNVFFL